MYDDGVLAVQVQDADSNSRPSAGPISIVRSSSMTMRRIACTASGSETPCLCVGSPIRTQTGFLSTAIRQEVLSSRSQQRRRRRSTSTSAIGCGADDLGMC